MRLLEHPTDGRACIVVGSGLIGRATVDQLETRQWRRGASTQVHWDDPHSLRRTMALVAEQLRGSGDVIWAAGAAGFSADSTQTSAEQRVFESLLGSFSTNTRFHLLSSAGGLYEGQRQVLPESAPAPQRPYGRLKLAQEQMVRDRFAQVAIYRPSSVFGTRRGRARRSLVAELVSNVMRQQTTTIVGRPDTLRDYVWVQDVARDLAGALDRPMSDQPRHLVSGRPTALSEAIDVVGRALQRTPLVQYRAPVNDAPITFSPTVRAEGFVPSPMRVAIASMVQCEHLLESDAARTRLDVA